MTRELLLVVLVLAGILPGAFAQEDERPPVQFRAVLHDPVRPFAELFYTDPTGSVVPLAFRPQSLTESLFTVPVNGSLVLYDKAEIDPENPAESMAASVKLPPNLKQAIVVVLPAPERKDPAYRMLVIDDSKRAFPKGESRVVPLIGTEIGIQAGEHMVRVRPGKIARVPPVRKVNDFNMAQTNFYYMRGDTWTVFTERQLQYLDACRRLFIVHATPGAIAPSVTTIVDTATP